MTLQKNYKRLLLKISWEAFTWSDWSVYDVACLEKIVKNVLSLQGRWYEIAIVCWWWNIWRFRDMQHLELPRVESDCLGIMATSMNASVLASSFKLQWWVAASFVSPWYTIPEHSRLFCVADANEYIWTWWIAICWWWTGHTHSTTDLAWVLRWLELSCDIVVKCSTVDGVYTKDPKKHADATRYDHLSHEQAVKEWLKVMDQAALWLARQENIDLCVCHMDAIESFWTDSWVWTTISST